MVHLVSSNGIIISHSYSLRASWSAPDEFVWLADFVCFSIGISIGIMRTFLQISSMCDVCSDLFSRDVTLITPLGSIFISISVEIPSGHMAFDGLNFDSARWSWPAVERFRRYLSIHGIFSLWCGLTDRDQRCGRKLFIEICCTLFLVTDWSVIESDDSVFRCFCGFMMSVIIFYKLFEPCLSDLTT